MLTMLVGLTIYLTLGLQICYPQKNIFGLNSLLNRNVRKVELSSSTNSNKLIVDDATNSINNTYNKLPWQIKILSRLLPTIVNNDSQTNLLRTQTKPTIAFSIIKQLHEFFLKHYNKFHASFKAWIQTHQKVFLYLTKGFGFALVTLFLIKRVMSWYRGIAEFEILVDKTDYIYQSYGSNLNGINSWLISRLNHSSIQHYNYQTISRNIENILDTPCFPLSMKDYAVRIGKEIVPIIYELDLKLRTHERTIKSIKAEQKPSSAKYEYRVDTIADLYEQKVIDNLLKSLLLIQARQTDVILRLTRFQILTALNACEDLLTQWKSNVVRKTQTFRLPIPRNIIENLPGFGRRIRVNALQSLQQTWNELSWMPFPGNSRTSNSRSRGLGSSSRRNGVESPSQHGRLIARRSIRTKSANKSNEYLPTRSLNAPLDLSSMNYSKIDIPNHYAAKLVFALDGSGQSPNSTHTYNITNNNSVDVHFNADEMETRAPLDINYPDADINFKTTSQNSVPNKGDLGEHGVENNADLDRLLKGLNAREKVIFLEELQTELYTMVGRVQEQLDRLESIDGRLVAAYKSEALIETLSTAATTYSDSTIGQASLQRQVQWNFPSSTAGTSNNQSIVEQDHELQTTTTPTSTPPFAWNDLELWVADASLLCKEALAMILLDRPVHVSSQATNDPDSLTLSFALSPQQQLQLLQQQQEARIHKKSSASKPSHPTYPSHKDRSIPSAPNRTREKISNSPTGGAHIASSPDLATMSTRLASVFTFPWPAPPIQVNSVTNDVSNRLNNDARIISSNTSITASLTTASKHSDSLSYTDEIPTIVHPSEFHTVLKTNLDFIRTQWRVSAILLQDLSHAPTAFQNHLESSGLKPKSYRGLLTLLKFKNVFRLLFWGSISSGIFEVTRRSEDIVEWSKAVFRNVKDFVSRRITTPAVSIVNDVIFNNRVQLTDRAALTDSMRSLQAMLNDFLKEYRPKMSEGERKRAVARMDMTPISLEYENELRRPMRNLVSGRIARLVLIQLQFVKKELLVAMQAIDELFNANQVNLQLMAVTPAVLSVIAIQIVLRATITTIRSSSRGRFVESTWAVQRDLRSGMRSLEKLLSLSSAYNYQEDDLTVSERGKLMSTLFRLQNLLVMHSSRFDDISLRLLQEDLREVSSSRLSVVQRLALVERILRTYPIFQPSRKLWPGGL